jgi:hypothetical protein
MVTVPAFGSNPTRGSCNTRTSAPVLPSNNSAAHLHFVPDTIAFWNEDVGIAHGSMTSTPCTIACGHAVAITFDGGHTWHVTLRGEYDSIGVVDDRVAWASRPCAGATCLMWSENSGRTWTPTPHHELIAHAVFLTPSTGYGAEFIWNGNKREYRLASTRDRGQHWTVGARLCADTPAYMPVTLTFVTEAEGWVACGGEPFSEFAVPKAIEHTTDGGSTWSVEGGAVLDPTPTPALGDAGAISELQYVDGRHAWLWKDFGIPLSTSDGGATWSEIPRFKSDDGRIAGADPTALATWGWFLSERKGYALESIGGRLYLRSTFDGGRTWGTVRTWRY